MEVNLHGRAEMDGRTSIEWSIPSTTPEVYGMRQLVLSFKTSCHSFSSLREVSPAVRIVSRRLSMCRSVLIPKLSCSLDMPWFR